MTINAGNRTPFDAPLIGANSIKCVITALLWSVIIQATHAQTIDNLRMSVDISTRLNRDITADNTSRVYALGLDSHKIFSNKNGDIGYGVGQLYFTKLSDQMPYSFLFDSPNDQKFVIREAHLNYTAGPAWMPNIRVGHFTLPFGLEHSLDTNGRLLDYYHGKNLGTKLDWGIGVNKVTEAVEYSLSYMLGGKDDPKVTDSSYIYTGRFGSLSYRDAVVGFSFFNANFDNIKRRRYAVDVQYYWHTFGVLTELAIGHKRHTNSLWKRHQYTLIELNKTSTDGQLKIYAQYTLNNEEGAPKNIQVINAGLSYQFSNSFELSVAIRRQVNSPANTLKQQLVRVQIRYRY